jgi:hypothetical protein
MVCQVVFSLNLVPGSAQTDGKGIERPGRISATWCRVHRRWARVRRRIH